MAFQAREALVGAFLIGSAMAAAGVGAEAELLREELVEVRGVDWMEEPP